MWVGGVAVEVAIVTVILWLGEKKYVVNKTRMRMEIENVRAHFVLDKLG